MNLMVRYRRVRPYRGLIFLLVAIVAAMAIAVSGLYGHAWEVR